MRSELVKVEAGLMEELERKNYLEQAAKALYLAALDCGVAVEQAKEEYVAAFVALDEVKCRVAKVVSAPGAARWDADFPEGVIRVVYQE